MEEKLSRYELGEIEKIWDEKYYRCVGSAYLDKQLEKTGLSRKVSRFQVAEKVRAVERGISLSR